MGLDVTAVERIALVAPIDQETDEEGVVCVYENPDFPKQADGLAPGWYRAEGRRHDFRAGSYSPYGVFREMLAMLVGRTTEAIWADHAPGPFYELIDFADNEGAIGPKTSRKLAGDFVVWQDRAKTYAETLGENGPGFLELYSDFRKAFEIAAGSGVVLFA
jgi:hypothetical protein